jgi:hypothetical protein
MRVRVWIDGDEGPSHDFELLAAPRIGDRISIAIEGQVEEGIVATVSWHLQGMERAGGSLALEEEPVGSVTMVHVVCRPSAEVIKVDFEGAEVDPAEAAIN